MDQSAGSVCGFLLSRHWYDTAQGLEIVLWAATGCGPLRVHISGEEAICFIERSVVVDAKTLACHHARRRPVALRALYGGHLVDAIYCRRQRDLLSLRDTLRNRGLRLYEADLKPVDRYLMERFVTAGFEARGERLALPRYAELHHATICRTGYQPVMAWMAIDIETIGLDGALLSIAAHGAGGDRVFMISSDAVESDEAEVVCVTDERSLLKCFLDWVAAADPDVLLGWNVVNFDLAFLEQRCRQLGIAFSLGRAGGNAAVLAPGATGVRVASVPGRVVLDGIDTLRTAFHRFESFELDHVAQSLLGRGKRIDMPAKDRVAEITRLYADDKPALAAYNIEDCRLVGEIFAHADLIEFVMRRAELTGLSMARQGGSVAAFDNLYLPRLHRKGRVAMDVVDIPAGPGSPGGIVLDSRPGLYDNVLLLDFKSLYPSIIRTFGIDPYGLHEPGDDPVAGFSGARFAREGAILPELITTLWAERDAAKRRRDAPMSQAIKILMNSFYGVLGAGGCRFHDDRLASSITCRGHEIIKRSREFIESSGFEVIYGDTDSVFVLLGDGLDESQARSQGQRLAADLNRWWQRQIATEHRLESCLEIEFETLFSRFLMPTVRGDHTGTKKRYAGLVRSPDATVELVFKGLESVRTDWTPLARRFQRELYRRVFLDLPYQQYVRDTVDALYAGQLDQELVYRKRIRRPIQSYRKNVPPHVQAARKLSHPPRWIRYVITAQGPEPVVERLPKPNYEHYCTRQLAPAADSLLQFLDTSLVTLTDRQLTIF